MEESNKNSDLEKILSMDEGSLNKIFSEMTPEEIEDLLEKINEVSDNE